MPVGNPADGNQDAVEHFPAGRRLALERDGQAVVARLHLTHAGVEVDGGVPPGNAFLQWPHQVRIGPGHQLPGQLHHRHPAAQRLIHAGHLQADDAATDDQQASGNVRQGQGAGGIHHPRIIPGQPRQLQGLGAGRDDGMRKTQFQRPVRRCDPHGVGPGEGAGALYHPHAAPAGHARQAVGKLPDDTVFPGAQPVQIDSGGTELHPMLRHQGRLFDHVGRVQQRLGRDTAHVEAYTAQAGVTLHQGYLQTQVGGPERRRVPTWPGTQHHQVVVEIADRRGRRNGRSGRDVRLAGSLRGCRLRLIHLRRSGIRLQGGNQGALGDGIPHRDRHRGHHAGQGGRHFHGGLVRFQGDQRLFGLHPVADRHQYLDYRHVREFPDIGHANFSGCGHVPVMLPLSMIS